MNLFTHLCRQISWSRHTFGPDVRPGVVDHIRKELKEIEASDYLDLEEWIDVVILGLDGAWRSLEGTAYTGDLAKADAIISMLALKQQKNEHRVWPDWRTADRSKAIEHDRSTE